MINDKKNNRIMKDVDGVTKEVFFISTEPAAEVWVKQEPDNIPPTDEDLPF